MLGHGYGDPRRLCYAPSDGRIPTRQSVSFLHERREEEGRCRFNKFLPLIPRLPAARIRFHRLLVSIHPQHVLERVDVVRRPGLYQRHEPVPNIRSPLRLVVHGVFPIQDRTLQESFGEIVAQRRPRRRQKAGQARPPFDEVVNRIARRRKKILINLNVHRRKPTLRHG